MLAALHRVDPAAVRLPRIGAGLSWRGDLETALDELGRPWTGGPYAEPARELLAGRPGRCAASWITWTAESAGLAAADVVITHGEPHPGNVIRRCRARAHRLGHGRPGPARARPVVVATESGDELRRYTELTGRPVDPAALEFYRLRWALDDLSCFVRDLRAPHRRTPGTEHAWQALETTLADLTVTLARYHPQPTPVPRCRPGPVASCA